MVKLPWIPGEAEWLRLLAVFADEPIRNRVMLALAYDAALRREELCNGEVSISDVVTARARCGFRPSPRPPRRR